MVTLIKRNVSPTKKPHVAIVGGGISGLLAAKQFADKGYSVDLFEASNQRLGGKIETFELNNVPIDMGAEFIDSNSRLLPLARSLGLEPMECADKDRHIIQLSDGTLLSDREFLDTLQPIISTIKSDKETITQEPNSELARNIDAMSLTDYLHAINHSNLPSVWLDTLARIYSAEACRKPEQISAQQFLAESSSDLSPEIGSLLASDSAYRIPGGMEGLIVALKNSLESKGVTFHLGTKATRVEKQDGQFALTFDPAQSTRTFDKVVFALPTKALSRIDGLSEIGVPQDVLTTLAECQYTHGVKMSVMLRPNVRALPSNSRFKSGAGFEAWQVDDNVMTFLIGGKAPEELKGKALAMQVLETFAQAYGKHADDIFDTQSIALRGPDLERPCYASPAPGQTAALHDLSASVDALAEQNIGIIGTYIPSRSGGSIGFMDNALESAERIAGIMIEQRNAAVEDTMTQRYAARNTNRQR